MKSGSKKGYHVAVVGATGLVGTEMIAILQERGFPVERLLPLASERSVDKEIEYNGNIFKVEELTKDSFKGIDIALFSAGGDRSKEFAPYAVKAGAIVIDNSNAFRMDKDVPLVVPEVNPEAIKGHKGIIANPNCSTIQMVVALNPIYKKVGIKRIVVSTYQAVSGTGSAAVEELAAQTRDLMAALDPTVEVYPYRIAFNCLPHIDQFLEGDNTREEEKMINETRKILGDPSIGISATTVRVPVFYAHSESVNVETREKITAAEVKKLLKKAPGVKLMDDPANNIYPMASVAAGQDEVFVGRIREDRSIANGINMWIVADNLRKGAALNAIQIAEMVK